MALKGAAERASDLGATDQALAQYQQALLITADPAERAELLERAAQVADLEARYEEAIALGYDAIAQYQSAADQTGVARTSALMGGILADASLLQETKSFLLTAIEQADRPEDAPYRADMLARLSRAHMRLAEFEQAVGTADQALAIAEPRRLTRITAEAFVNKAASLGGLGRLTEPVVLMTAAVELAHEVGDVALELRARNNLAAVQGTENGNAALQVSREAYELATRLGIRQMSTWLAGAIGLGSYFEGLDWDTSIRDIEAEIAGSRSDIDRRRLLGMIRIFQVARGQDTSGVDADLSRLEVENDDPDIDLWMTLMRGDAALFGGRPDAAIPIFREAAHMTAQNTGEARVGLVLASHFARDLDAAREAVSEMDKEVYSGHYVEGSALVAEAGVAALEDRGAEALSGFRAAIEHFERSGARFVIGLAQLDALWLLPEERSIDGWADAVRERFEAVKSPPLLERLDEVLYARGHGGDDRAPRVAAPERRAVDALADAAGPGGASA